MELKEWKHVATGAVPIYASRVGRVMRSILVAGVSLIAVACQDLAGSAPLPAGTVDPSSVKDARGADGMAVAARLRFQRALGPALIATGVLSDELQALDVGGFRTDPSDDIAIDARLDTEESFGLYLALHSVRTYTRQAIGALRKYDADNAANRVGLMYAMQGYAELWLADFFCSGVPLSTYDFEKDYTYGAGLTTDQVYRHAAALFDTALATISDSLAVYTMASVGLARANLALGRYAEAGEKIKDVATSASVSELICSQQLFRGAGSPLDRGCSSSYASIALANSGTVANLEGGNGYPYRSARDPRTASPLLGTTIAGSLVYFPAKYRIGASAPFVVASGIEARLIEAEAALHAGQIERWYGILRNLRTTGQVTRIDTTFGGVDGTEIVAIDTVWSPGTAGIEGIRPLPSDPGVGPLPEGRTAFDVRVDLTFAERAAWLFLTAHRQGDLRRLVRKYQRPKSETYPNGAYPGLGLYGSYIDVRVPRTEHVNPLFRGCLTRD